MPPKVPSAGRRLCLPAVLTMLLATGAAALEVSPEEVSLDRPEASQQLLISAMAAGRRVDLTRAAIYQSGDPTIATVDPEGLVRPVAEGRTQIVVRHEGQEIQVPVEVRGLADPPPISFRNEISPLLTKAGCNAGGCHGKAEGQNGFRLSVFGFDAAFDHDAIVKESRGRRIFTAAPEKSLFLRKATGDEPHGGGQRLQVGGPAWRRLVRWIAAGAPAETAEASPIAGIEVEPSEQVLVAGGQYNRQQLRVTAFDRQGRRWCVTAEAQYESNAETIAGVDARGLVEGSDTPGEAAILVRYMDHVAVARITIPQPGVHFTRPPERNFVDRLVWNKLTELGIEPSDLCDDATFLRRASLDTIGTLPTAEEARAFLADTSADKRPRLVERLLARQEYADYWTMRWSDILRVDKDKITPAGAVAMTRWLRQQIEENRPYDQFVREILAARGDAAAEGPASFYKVLDQPEVISRSVSQLFLGVRIECAQCHHHPSERWGQDDYYALAGFFTGVKRKKLADGGEAIVSRDGTELKHPRTGELVPVRALGGPPLEFAPGADRRLALADWMTSPENPFFAKMIANRLWAHYFGRGLVEPIDDMRATNPATNEPLLEALAGHLREVKYDLKAFTRTLLDSRVYQLSAATNASNASDVQNFSHALQKALPAEVLLDAICQTTGVPEKFNGWPEGHRAICVWDNRMPSYFFRVFGRPVRASVCECERSNEPSIAQALHLMNSPEIGEKIQSRHGLARRLAESEQSPEQIIEELYLTTLSRPSLEEEQKLMLEAFAVSPRRQAVEDVLWTLLNTKEFIYNH